MASERTLVVGATGRVGQEVVRALLARGATVRALVRTPQSAARLPAGAEPALGALGSEADVGRALQGVEGAFFITPHHPREEALGLAFVASCERAGVKRIVYSGGYHPDLPTRALRWALHSAFALIAPHYSAKLAVERRVRASPASPVVLMPSNFFQNDELEAREIVGGVYPLPLGRRPVNRVDVRDIAEAAARALLDRGGVAPGGYPLLGPDSWTGEACAQLWSSVLGRPVRYGGDDVEAWKARMAGAMDAAALSDFGKTYALLQRYGVSAPAREVARCAQLLGRPPRSYADYVRDAAARWTAAATG